METVTNVEIQSIGGDMLDPHNNIIAVMVSFNHPQCGNDKVWLTFRKDGISVCGKPLNQPHGMFKWFAPEDAKTVVEALNSVEIGREVIAKYELTEADFNIENKIPEQDKK